MAYRSKVEAAGNWISRKSSAIWSDNILWSTWVRRSNYPSQAALKRAYPYTKVTSTSSPVIVYNSGATTQQIHHDASSYILRIHNRPYSTRKMKYTHLLLLLSMLYTTILSAPVTSPASEVGSSDFHSAYTHFFENASDEDILGE